MRTHASLVDTRLEIIENNRTGTTPTLVHIISELHRIFHQMPPVVKMIQGARSVEEAEKADTLKFLPRPLQLLSLVAVSNLHSRIFSIRLDDSFLETRRSQTSDNSKLRLHGKSLGMLRRNDSRTRQLLLAPVALSLQFFAAIPIVSS